MRCLVVDDHPLIREALGNVLRRLGEAVVVELAGDCEEGFEMAAGGLDFDLLLLDLNIPGLSGIAAVKGWRTRFPALPVIVLSAARDQQTMLAALGAGAAGFIPKSTSNELMLNAVRIVLDGGRYLPPELLSPSGPRTVSARPPPPSLDRLGLTERQMDVLRLIAGGASNKAISRELGLAERTVKAHLTAVFRALEVTSRTQLAIAATRLGLGGSNRAIDSPTAPGRP